MTTLLLLLVILGLCNGAPIVAAALLKNRWNRPVDGGFRYTDGRFLLGESKTLRGLLVAMIVAVLAAGLLGFGFAFGVLFGAMSMLGDLVSSFIKRRLNIAVSGQALLLDQLPESLIPLLYAQQVGLLGMPEVLIGVVLFTVVELLVSPILHKLKIRKRPF